MTWGRLWIVGAAALTGCVIETGYDQDTDPRFGGGDASAEDNPDDVLYSAAAPLTSAPGPVNILGLPGVLADGQAGTLKVDGKGAVAVTGSAEATLARLRVVVPQHIHARAEPGRSGSPRAALRG